MIRRLYSFLVSLDLGIWLTVGVLLLLAVGSFGSGASESGSINDLPLFLWLRGAPLSSSWWLWAALMLLAVLAINAFLCTIESLRFKAGRGNLIVTLAPQFMHVGFLLIMVAHLLSASGGYKQVLQVEEGSVIGFPDGGNVRVGPITATAGPMGMMTGYGVDFRYDAGGKELVQRVGPNHPLFHKGVGFYVKDVGMVPNPAALVEIHREPGAGAALAGALFFTVGNVFLLAVRRGR